MAITLQEAKVGMADKVDQQIIDMFCRSSYLLDNMVFDNCISPGTGGSTLAYGYLQLTLPSTASVRAIGSEFASAEAKKEKKITNAVVMGGSFQVDRVLQNTSGMMDELAFQAEQKVKATANYFHNLVINGDTDKGEFDGLKKLLTNSGSEYACQVPLRTTEEMDTNCNAFLDDLDALLAMTDGRPNMLLMNTFMLLKLRSIARRAGYYDRSVDGAGRTIETYAGIPLVDMGMHFDGQMLSDVIPIEDTGTTCIYSVCMGLDGFHGIPPTGTGVITTYMPDMNAPGAVKTGEVELVAGIALKNTMKAAVMKGIPVFG